MMTERLRYRIVVLIVSYDLKKTQQREREREKIRKRRDTKIGGKCHRACCRWGFWRLVLSQRL